MKIQILGTTAGGGIPCPFCSCEVCTDAIRKGRFFSRCCICVNDSVLIDFPNEIRYFMVKYRLDLNRIFHVFMTHSHGDHFNPMDLTLNRSIINTTSLSEERPLEICGSKTVLSRVWKKDDPLCRLTELHPYESRTAGGVTITPIPSNHDPREECFTFIISEGQKHLFYCTDSGYPPQDVLDKLKSWIFCGVICECTNGLLPSPEGHMNLEKVDLLRRHFSENGLLQGGAPWYLTHIYHKAYTGQFLQQAAELGFILPEEGQILNF